MKISKNVQKPKADTSCASNKYDESKKFIQCAIDCLAEVALDGSDEHNVLATSAIADLGVVMLSLK